MSEEEINTEQKIIEAAKKIFLVKGLDGARMQQIADEAGINKALVHYYFRTKDKLFDRIFADAFGQFMPRIGQVMMSDSTFFEKIRLFISHYIDVMVANPYLPVFVLNEVTNRPEKLVGFIKGMGVNPDILQNIIDYEVNEGRIKPIYYKHLIANIVGMCLFPFLARPILQGFLFNDDVKAYNKFIAERKEQVTSFVLAAISKQ